MATVLRRIDPLASTLADVCNKLKKQVGAGSNFHLDVSEVTVTAADGDGTLATALVLVNQIKAVYNFHCADTLALKAADATNADATAAATDLASAQTLANNLKSEYTAHIASTSAHYNADATNTIVAANASNQGTLDTLITELKAKMNLHWGSGGAPTNAAPSIRLVNA